MRKVSVYGEVEVPDEVADALRLDSENERVLSQTVYLSGRPSEPGYSYNVVVQFRWNEVGDES